MNNSFLHLPNLFSLLRISVAFVFLLDNVFYRCAAIILAMLSDILDGYIARRYQLVTRFGTVIDPVADRFFVFFALVVLLGEGRLSPWQAGTMVCRDLSVMLFGCYLAFRGRLLKYRFRSILSGKATTSLQFLVLIALTLHVAVPGYMYIVFILLGLSALVELYLTRHSEGYSNP